MTGTPEAATTTMLRRYAATYPVELARQLDGRPAEDIGDVLADLPPGFAARVLEHLLPEDGIRTVDALDDATLRDVVPAVSPARAAAFLAGLPEERRSARLALLDERTAAELGSLMSYPPDSAGAIMDPRVAALHPSATVKDAQAVLRRMGDRRIHRILLVDDEGRLTGAVPLQELALAAPADRLETLEVSAPVSVAATASQTEVVDLFEVHKGTSLPVVDFEGRLVGTIRHAALVDTLQTESAADMLKMVGASREERGLSPVLFAVRKRLPWLQINLLTAFLAAAVVGLFEGTIAQYTALAVLLPVAAGQSGNTGAQALAVTMRGLALRELRVRHWLRLGFKELGVGLINGVAVALVTSIAVFIWSDSAGLAVVIGTAMVLSMTIAGIAGASVPMALTILRQDPAQSSSIILTTITDIAGFLSFLGLATLLSGML